MADQAPGRQIDSDQVRISAVPRWSPALRVAFRFCFLYCSLACVVQGAIDALLPIPDLKFPSIETFWPIPQITSWTAVHVFHITRSLVYPGGSDSTSTWVNTFCLLVFAAVATVIWSVLDRRRENYDTLNKWFRLFLRFTLAALLFGYGFFKVIPLQMAYPTLVRLMEPFGHLSRGALLFCSIGPARVYEVFGGLAEVMAGILLVLPRTTTPGALLALADTIEVFTLNVGYNFIVKLFSLHLVLYSLVLLAPAVKRIFNFFFSGRPASLPFEPPLLQSSRANRIAVALQVLFGLFLIGMNLHTDIHLWYTRGGGRPHPSLYGIWDVDQMTIDGTARPPLLTDNARWRRVLFDYTTSTSFQRMDDSFVSFNSSINDRDKILMLTKADDKNWIAGFKFDHPAQDQLILDGAMDGHAVHMQLKLFDRNKLPMVADKFHWISEY